MPKLILLSVIIVSVFLPMMFAAKRRPRANLRIVLGLVLVYIFIWAQLCMRVYPDLVKVE
jgi:hypothetical protein